MYFNSLVTAGSGFPSHLRCVSILGLITSVQKKFAVKQTTVLSLFYKRRSPFYSVYFDVSFRYITITIKSKHHVTVPHIF
jgi:hypothetical protein